MSDCGTELSPDPYGEFRQSFLICAANPRPLLITDKRDDRAGVVPAGVEGDDVFGVLDVSAQDRDDLGPTVSRFAGEDDATAGLTGGAGFDTDDAILIQQLVGGDSGVGVALTG